MASLFNTVLAITDEGERWKVFDELTSECSSGDKEAFTDLLLTTIASESSLGRVITKGPGDAAAEADCDLLQSTLQKYLPAVAERFRIDRFLGRGGMGAVFEVFDRQRSERVAMKILRGSHPELLLMFKREFRGVQGFSHRNLVTLFEFFGSPSLACFTMELVEGRSFISHLISQPDREDAVRDLFPKIAAGLRNLHDGGKQHRDIKPSNLLVADGGTRPVILDYGLLSTTAGLGEDFTRGSFAGTLPYLAPEILRGEPPHPGGDWYALGVVLFQSLVGELPFKAGQDQLLYEIEKKWPLVVTSLDRFSGTLAGLCRDLLHPDPGKRAGHREIMALSPQEELPTANSGSDQGTLIGRDEELVSLTRDFQRAARGTPSLVFLHGQSGIGKSFLCDHFLHEHENDALVLKGRCYENEAIAYKAVDEIIDQLSEYLGGISPRGLARLVPEDAHLLVTMFPVLERVGFAKLSPSDPAESPGPLAARQRGFRALGTLLRNLAERSPLLVSIDDLQWCDPDSVALFSAILPSLSEARLMLLLSHREISDHPNSPLQDFRDACLAPGLSVRDLPLEALSENDSALLTRSIRGAGDGEIDERLTRALAIARGNPFLIQQLVRSEVDLTGDIQLGDLLAASFGSLGQDGRRVLELLSVATKPLRRREIIEAAGLDHDFQKVESSLRAARIIKSSGPGWEDTIEPYHDRIREDTVASLSPPILKRRHGGLANALELNQEKDEERLAYHFSAAGERPKACGYYHRAGEKAGGQLAFDHAAALFQGALANSDGGVEEVGLLEVSTADALTNAGRAKDAGEYYSSASRKLTGAAGERFVRRAVHEFLIGGYIDEARSGLAKLVERSGIKMQATGKRAVVKGNLKRVAMLVNARRMKKVDPEGISQRDLDLLDDYWTVSLGFGLSDSMRIDDVLAEGLKRALGIGDPAQVIRFLALDSTHTGATGNLGHRLTRSRLDYARKLCDQHPSPYSEGMVAFGESATAYMAARMTDSKEYGLLAGKIFREKCHGVMWERDAADTYYLLSLIPLGQFNELAGAVEVMAKDAESRSDLHLATSINCYPRPWSLLARDQAEEAESCALESLGKWCDDLFHFQTLEAWVVRIDIALYRGDGEGALTLLDEGWSDFVEAGFSFVQHVRMLLKFARGRALVMTAGSETEIMKVIRSLKREFHWLGKAFIRCLEAALLLRSGKESEACKALEGAGRLFIEHDFQLYSHAVGMALGHLAEDPLQIRDAVRSYLSLGIMRPERLAVSLLPGIF